MRVLRDHDISRHEQNHKGHNDGIKGTCLYRRIRNTDGSEDKQDGMRWF